MNDEIKKINLPKKIEEAFSCIDNELSVCNDELLEILNYIINLQNENERLKVNYKNDKSHQVNFDYFQLLYNKYSKDIIIDDLVYKCEDLDNCKKGYEKAIIKYGDYKSRCEEAQYLISHELSHLKANDEITWNKEFYDENNKLDYRKLCIELLNQIEKILNGGNNE